MSAEPTTDSPLSRRQLAMRVVPPGFTDRAVEEIAATPDVDGWLAWLYAHERELRVLDIHAHAEFARIEAANRERVSRFTITKGGLPT